MSSGLALPPIQGPPQQPTPPPAFEPPRSQSPMQGRGQTQTRPLSPTPNAGIRIGARDCMRGVFAVSLPPDPEPTAPPISGPSPLTILPPPPLPAPPASPVPQSIVESVWSPLLIAGGLEEAICTLR
ncbi:hypothetical protein BGW80DRAFT_1251759 [Lactifluus volemus]|nr:hypothetical protein BGW80DRAFT_1251759 [Lactifluus volemus]